jgi:hypothetical protein
VEVSKDDGRLGIGAAKFGVSSAVSAALLLLHAPLDHTFQSEGLVARMAVRLPGTAPSVGT